MNNLERLSERVKDDAYFLHATLDAYQRLHGMDEESLAHRLEHTRRFVYADGRGGVGALL
jgi:hypothetical protein